MSETKPEISFFVVSMMEVHGIPVIDPKKRIDFRGWCEAAGFDSREVLIFLLGYSRRGSFPEAWKWVLKARGGIMASVATFMATTLDYFLSPLIQEKFREWWNRDVVDHPEAGSDGIVSACVFRVG